jgi:hypothetical protein
MILDRLPPTPERLTKMIAGKVKYPVNLRTDDKYHYIQTPFNLKDEIAAMKGAKWMGYANPPEKVWRVDNCRRNNFNLAYLEGQNPYAKYLSKAETAQFTLPPTRLDVYGQVITPYAHQDEMTIHALLRKQCIIAGEMGTGKTLAIFRAIEASLVDETWYVAPKSALASVKLEAWKWRFSRKTIYMTYEELKKTLQNWLPGRKPPRFVVFDESSRVKTPTSQRSQAAFYLAENMRDAWGDDCYIVLMSGSPAPKSPLDWYYQCEIACPGFVKEGDIHKFERRLAVMKQQEDITGTKFNRRLAWKDGNPNVCNFCGGPKVHACHDDGMHREYHEFVPIENELEKLYRRMSGLVLVKLKKDCLDLPEKQYQIRKLKPSLDLLRAARLVTAGSRSAIESMTLLRELSDGFQYKDTITGSDPCSACQGNKVYWDNAKNESVPCPECNATGSKNKVEREIIEVPSPKMEQLTEDLDAFEDTGRLVVYAGFTGSIDRICAQVKKCGWEFIRVDGRGWYNSIDHKWDTQRCLQEFQSPKSEFDKIVFVGHPGSAGMGLTLTASPAIIYYSNDFNAESRIQSEDRIHRAGMDVNRGATIIDYVLLPTDQKVLDNLKRKRELQSISIGELQHAMDTYSFTTDGP